MRREDDLQDCRKSYQESTRMDDVGGTQGASADLQSAERRKIKVGVREWRLVQGWEKSTNEACGSHVIRKIWYSRR